MKQQANIDMLTGLYNRRFLEDYTRKLLAIARRRERPVGLIMIDLDHFKSFNDLYGHEIGDRMLRHFAKTVTGSMRETNLASRYGGEEFIIILPDTDIKSSMLVAERIRKAVMVMVVPSNTEKPLPQLTVSLGVAAYPLHGQTLEEVIQASDKALYESKRGGRNRVTAASDAGCRGELIKRVAGHGICTSEATRIKSCRASCAIIFRLKELSPSLLLG